MALNIKTCRNGIQFSAIIQPLSSKNKICGIQGESLRIRLTSPPVENAANKMCIKFLAKQLDITLSQITIVSGQKGRNKIIRIEEIEKPEFITKVLKLNKS
jgi:uncharacterized protein